MCGETQEAYAAPLLVGHHRRLAIRFPTQAFLSPGPRPSLGYPRRLRSSSLFRALWAQGRQFLDWSADYRLHARAAWQPQDLFQPILAKARPFCRGRYTCVAVDDTRLHKTGRRIVTASYQRDPLSPKFRINLMFGLRFLQMSLLTPLYRSSKQPARALPVRFQEVPALKKPRRKAPQQEWEAWRQQSKLHNLSTHTVETLRGLRGSLDAAGYADQTLLAVCDNSFCNRTVFRAEFTRTSVIARARRDVKLCRGAVGGGRRFYDVVKFTPKQVYDDPAIAWQKVRIFHGGQWRKVRYKQVAAVYWQGGAGQKPLRLFVVARIPYQVPGRERKSYGDPAFLLTTDLRAPRENYSRPTSTAGRLRSTIAKRRTRWASVRPNSALPNLFLVSRPSSWQPTAPSC